MNRLLVLVALSSLTPSVAHAAESSPSILVDRLKTVFEARDASGYLALWSFRSREIEDEERIFASRLTDWPEVRFIVEYQGPLLKQPGRYRLCVTIFELREPRGREDEWSFILEKGDAGWSVVERQSLGTIEGLTHISLEPQGFKVSGHVLALEDFELHMDRGTLFMNQSALGPTLLVFVGDGRVRVSPRPPVEREVLAKFSGHAELSEVVHTAFIRIHPADVHRVLKPSFDLEPDPHAGERFPAAREFFQSEVFHSFVLDTDLPGSPWWVFPSPGDALVTFRTGGHGTLTFTVFGSESEGISLFDRAMRHQICMYPAGGQSTRYNEDEGRTADVLRHDLHARFDFDRDRMEADDTIRLKLLTPSHTLRLRLDEAFQVRSITSEEGGTHAFYRVRDQQSLMVSLGALSGSVGEVTLRVRYGGPVRSGPIDAEAQVLTRPQTPMETSREQITLERSLVLSSKTPWYPGVRSDDYALATLHLDVPAGYFAVAGGTLVSTRLEAGRRLLEFQQDRPEKYLAVAVARLQEDGHAEVEGVSLRAYAAPRLKRDAAQGIQSGSEILRFYTKEFGPCPYPEVSLVFLESENGGGHSPPGMAILAKRPLFLSGQLRSDPGNFSDIPTFFLAHELAHQWWGHGVAGENYHERWISEGFAQYAATLWVREKYGESAFRDVLRRLARWAIKANEEGPISLGQRLSQIRNESWVYRAIVYDKGAYVLLMLRTIAGQEAFRKTLLDLQVRYRFGKIGTEDFEKILDENTGRDLSSYVRDWVFGTRLPSVRFSRRSEPSGPSYRTTVTLRPIDLPGPLPLEVSVLTDAGTQTAHVSLTEPESILTVETRTTPKRVEVNEDLALLLRIHEGS